MFDYGRNIDRLCLFTVFKTLAGRRIQRRTNYSYAITESPFMTNNCQWTVIPTETSAPYGEGSMPFWSKDVQLD
jgi:hypothetical protein